MTRKPIILGPLPGRPATSAGISTWLPIVAVGGEKSFGPGMAAVMRTAATQVSEGVIADAGHWLMEEQPDATVKMIDAFLSSSE